ncbi:hypothetical protein [Desulfotruncus alcoholivorax]|nr:hypothetical protein [Desulfotruncus alcoholivorax]
MTLELPVFVQCEGSWLALSACGEVVVLGGSFEDAFNKSFLQGCY